MIHDLDLGFDGHHEDFETEVNWSLFFYLLIF